MADYTNWTKEDLINKIRDLENMSHSRVPRRKEDEDKDFRFSAYSTRKIALKFAYSGWEYNGLAYQHVVTPLPTVEAVLFDALATARMIDEDKGFTGCGWEKCGRTDRGVSAAGQVISLYVRSALVAKREDAVATVVEDAEMEEDDMDLFDGGGNSSLRARPVREHDYAAILNRLLPPTIRVLAWSPVAETFSARFNCTSRHYKYFFSSLNLDISLMRQAAAHLVGLHDFRNLCKIDPAKQITIFHRRIMSADIEPVEGEKDMYVLNLKGSAFLYHQVRCIMSILFLVGRNLESPDIIVQLLNVTENAEPGDWEVLPRKPEYQMADGIPLVLWECGYSEGDVTWQMGPNKMDRHHGQGRNLYHHLEAIYEQSRVYTTMNRHFLIKAAEMGHTPREIGIRGDAPLGKKWTAPDGIEITYGGGETKRLPQYFPLMLRRRNDSAEVVNARYRESKGMRRELKKNGNGEGAVEEGDDVDAGNE